MLVNSFALDAFPLNSGSGSTPIPSTGSPLSINGAALNVYPIDGVGDVPGMTVQVVDCRNLVVTFVAQYDHFRALSPSNWGLSLGGWINRVKHITGDDYAVNTSRCLAGVVYTILADV